MPRWFYHLYSTTASSNSITASITPLISPSVTISSSASTVCAGNNVNFSASASNAGSSPTYQWKLNGANVGTNSPSYSSSSLNNGDQVLVEVTGSGACASSSPGISSAISMNIRPLPVISVMSPPFAPLCPGDSLALSATVNNHNIPGILTNWTGPGVQNGVFYASLAGPGNHTLSIGYLYASQPDCPVNATLQISVANFPTPTISRNGGSLSCNQAGFNYLWLLNGSPAPGTNNLQNYNLTVNGSYSVELSDATCSLESDEIDVIDMSLRSLKSQWTWQVYPNPAKSQLNFALNNPGVRKVEIRLYDARGALMLAEERIVNGARIEESLNIGAFADGVYHLNVRAGDLEFHERIRKS